MRRPPNPALLADLAALLAKYDPEELRDALDVFANPEGVANLAKLVARAFDEGIRAKVSERRTPGAKGKLSDEERLARIKAARADDAALIDEVVATASLSWSKSRVQHLRELTRRYNERHVSGTTVTQRRTQLISLVERAPRAMLEEFAGEFRQSSRGEGTLQEWSDIILRDRKPKTRQ